MFRSHPNNNVIGRPCIAPDKHTSTKAKGRVFRFGRKRKFCTAAHHPGRVRRDVLLPCGNAFLWPEAAFQGGTGSLDAIFRLYLMGKGRTIPSILGVR